MRSRSPKAKGAPAQCNAQGGSRALRNSSPAKSRERARSSQSTRGFSSAAAEQRHRKGTAGTPSSRGRQQPSAQAHPRALLSGEQQARPERGTPSRPRNPALARLSGPRRSAGSAVQREPRPPAAASSRSAGTGQRARAARAQSRQLPARRRSSSGLAPSGRTHPQPGPGSSWRAGGRSGAHRAEHRARAVPRGPAHRPAGPAPQQRPALLARRAARSKRASHWLPAAKGRGSAGFGDVVEQLC